MTISQLDKLKEKDLVKNINTLVPTAGTTIPAGTIHVVLRRDTSTIETQTVDVAQVRCAFTLDHALQLLHIYENPRR